MMMMIMMMMMMMMTIIIIGSSTCNPQTEYIFGNVCTTCPSGYTCDGTTATKCGITMYVANNVCTTCPSGHTCNGISATRACSKIITYKDVAICEMINIDCYDGRDLTLRRGYVYSKPLVYDMTIDWTSVIENKQQMVIYGYYERDAQNNIQVRSMSEAQLSRDNLQFKYSSAYTCYCVAGSGNCPHLEGISSSPVMSSTTSSTGH